ncbi:hypothetical protein QO058_13530 [Bosea vestrisii]|uniref:hypothetical protein n=1 Tax=Bosea vestrisii TaxID=151416 RepID=UPI0024DFB5FA|nr:hypothetical protein [Bosea vestrisii]WID99165.1 hypothetical protein QO058_13530 [Bosea vestrisii]
MPEADERMGATETATPDRMGSPAPDWQPLQPQTLVDHTIEAIIAGGAAGLILPGDRIVEVELARKLGGEPRAGTRGLAAARKPGRRGQRGL